MMLPPTTSWPPNFFTPRRRPAESRPLRDEPPAFLCAISNYLLLLVGGLLGRRILGRLLGGRLLRGGILRGLFGSGRLLRSRGLLRSFLGFRSLGGSLRLGLRLRSVGSRSGLGLRRGCLLRRCLGSRSLGGSRRLGLRLRSVGSRSGLGLRSGFLLRRSLLGLGGADRDDAQQRQLLAMAGLAAIVVPAALLENRDLLALR